MEKKIQIFLLNIYIALSFIAAYQTKIRNSILVCLALVSFVNFIFFSKNFFKKNKNDLYVYLLFLLLIISLFFNFSIYNMLYVVINIITIFSCMLISKTHYIYIKKILEKQTIIFNYLNLFLLSFFNITYKSPKIIFGYLVFRRRIDLINLSNISVWALLLLIFSIWNSKKKKSKLAYYLNILVAIILIFFSGKINIFIALVFILFLIFLQKIINKSSFILFFILFSFFNSSLLFLGLKEKIQKTFNVVAIATGRDKLWEDYFKFIYNEPKKILTGFSFYQDSVSILKHPHNQYLMIFYILGIFGAIVYFSLFFKVLKNTYKKNTLFFYLNISIFILMTGDDYYVLTVLPIYFLIIMGGLNYNNNYNKFTMKGMKKCAYR